MPSGALRASPRGPGLTGDGGTWAPCVPGTRDFPNVYTLDLGTISPLLNHVLEVSKSLWFVLGPGGLREAPGGPGKAYGGLWGPPGGPPYPPGPRPKNLKTHILLRAPFKA